MLAPIKLRAFQAGDIITLNDTGGFRVLAISKFGAEARYIGNVNGNDPYTVGLHRMYTLSNSLMKSYCRVVTIKDSDKDICGTCVYFKSFKYTNYTHKQWQGICGNPLLLDESRVGFSDLLYQRKISLRELDSGCFEVGYWQGLDDPKPIYQFYKEGAIK